MSMVNVIGSYGSYQSNMNSRDGLSKCKHIGFTQAVSIPSPVPPAGIP
jgi:hypothetical protein